jgi:multiple sugar transport system permease protein
MDFFSEFSKARQGSGFRALFNLTPMKRREAAWGFAFIAPWLLGFLFFYLAPMVISLVFSVYDFTLSNPDEAHFIGFDNWRRMLLEDPKVWETLLVTLRFAVISLPIGMVTAFLLAVLLNSKNLIGRNVFRTLFYAPTMIPGIASILIWSSVLNSQSGWVNRLISLTGWDVMGINGLRWLDDPQLVYIAYTFIGLYGIGNAILINLASLQGVPTELYEAAEIDGANWGMRLLTITVPMVTPVIFYNLVLGVVGLLQYFTVPWILNRGSGYPEGTTNFYMVYFYRQSFEFQNMGYGAALAWLMFFVALLITLFLFWSGRFWVYYSGERDS